MLSLTPVIRLLTPKPSDFDGIWFRRVGGAAEFAQAHAEALPLPACWIIRGSDKSQHAGERAENVTISFDAVIAVSNARVHKPGDTDDQLLAYRLAVKTLLLGFVLEDGVRPLKFDGGRVLEYSEGDFYWADRYTFEALITNYLPDPPAFEGVSPINDKDKPS
jgi:hypothetical protein